MHWPKLRDHELFAGWFVNAIVTENIGQATDALTGNSKDKGADVILIDDRVKAALVFQGKNEKAINNGT
jgi:hypothetical protein